MEVKFVDLKAVYPDIREEIETKFKEIIDESRFVGSKYMKQLESDFGDYLGRPAVAMNCGTSSLIASLMAIELQPGDEVIVPANTFIATADAVSILGGKPVFVDIDPNTYNINPKLIPQAITQKTKAIIPVHLYGQCADMKQIGGIATKHGRLSVIEDACQAHGSTYYGRPAGTLGDLSAFSFYPSKNLGAWGEAGAVSCATEYFREEVTKIRDHGSLKKYEHQRVGGNFHMDELQAAVLTTKLKYLDKWNDMRRECATHYNSRLGDIEKIVTPTEAEGNRHVYHLYVVRVDHRDMVRNRLWEDYNIGTGIHYPTALHLSQTYIDRLWVDRNKRHPIATTFSQRILSLPMFPGLTADEIDYVCDKLIKVVNELS